MSTESLHHSCGAIVLATAHDPIQEALFWEELGGHPVFAHAIVPLLTHPNIMSIVVVVAEHRLLSAKTHLMTEMMNGTLAPVPPVTLQIATTSLADGLRAGLAAIDAKIGWVIVQDGARAFTPPDLIAAIQGAARPDRLIAPAIPARDTIKQVDSTGRVIASPDRAGLVLLQTPVIGTRAHWESIQGEGSLFALALAAGLPIMTIPGTSTNTLISTREDLERFRWEETQRTQQ